MPNRNWLILTALAMEADAVAAVIPPQSGISVKIVGPRARGLNDDLFKNRRGVFLAGLAGALDPALKVGDVVFQAAEGDRIASLPCIWGKIHSSDGLVSTPADKARLFARTGASAVDMESDVVMARAAIAGLPVVVIRAISDGADETVPPELLHWVDSAGRPRPMRIFLGFLRKPTLLFAALRLRRNSNLALKNMAAALRQYIDLFASSPPTEATGDR